MHCCVTMHTVLNMSLRLIFFKLVLLMVFKLPRKNVFHLNQLVKTFTQSLVGTRMLRIIMLWLEMHSGCGISMGDPTKANYTTV